MSNTDVAAADAPSKDDKGLADGIRARLIETMGPVLAVLTEAKALGFATTFQFTDKDSTDGSVMLGPIKITKQVEL